MQGIATLTAFARNDSVNVKRLLRVTEKSFAIRVYKSFTKRAARAALSSTAKFSCNNAAL